MEIEEAKREQDSPKSQDYEKLIEYNSIKEKYAIEYDGEFYF